MSLGVLHKMTVSQGNPIQYRLFLDGEEVNMNDFIGHSFKMEFTGSIFCLKCHQKTSTSFGQGYCYSCFMNAPENSECIIRPELCQAHLGKGRNPEWEEIHHNQPHIVYLAASDAIKVGVTRNTQIPTRWIDQGASHAIILCRTPNRYEAGRIEVALKALFTDRTNWRNMLKNEIDSSIDLLDKKWELEELLPSDITEFISDDEEVFSFQYPVIRYPQKMTSINLNKTPIIDKSLMGIKGQYLLFSDETVINLRKYGGYQVSI